MTTNTTDDILRAALNAAADATDTIAPGQGDALRRFASEKCSNAAHVLLTPQTCTFRHEDDWPSCPVCDGGLAICRNCGKYELELDDPVCRASQGVHDGDTCMRGGNGPCEACQWAENASKRPFPEQSTYDLSEQQAGESAA